MKPSINLQRLRSDLESLGQIGRDRYSRGINRPGFSDADLQARHWLKERFESFDMQAIIDQAGNVVGRWGDSRLPSLIMGSHLDSVPQGGLYDGTLGVLAGLEVIRCLQDAGIKPEIPIEVIATSEEEGRFGGMLGAQALTGELDLDWLENATDDAGIFLKDAMKKQGFNHLEALKVRRPDSSMKAFLELHIEQGPVLEQTGKTIGIVEGIAGVFHWLVSFEGEPNHAGTTPMTMRRDAFMALADFAHSIPRVIDRYGSTNGRLTIGKVDLAPGFAHTVPGKAEFTLVGKDFENTDLKNLAEGCRQQIASVAEKHDIGYEIHESSFLHSQSCDPAIVSIMQSCADELNVPSMKMYSGAGHDTQIFARHTPSGMIFVPSIAGVSHSPDEETSWADIEIGATILLNTVLRLIG